MERWLIKKDDEVLYRRFKEFGQGRLKLWKLHVEEYLDSFDEPPQELKEFSEFLDAEVNQDVWEEFQEIDLGGTFSGEDARKMAQSVGMDRDYKLLFVPASATTHGEWSALDRYVLQRCLNPLHRWHRVPRSDFSTPIGPQLLDTAIDMVSDLVDEYREHLKPRTQDS